MELGRGLALCCKVCESEAIQSALQEVSWYEKDSDDQP